MDPHDPQPGVDADQAERGPTGIPLAFVASFDEFYRLHYAKIAGSLAISLGDLELGREATDEAMTRAYVRWATVSGHDNPAGWVYRVGLNWGRSVFRRARRATELLPFVERQTIEWPATADPALRAALLRLDYRHRAVVVCRYYLDWTTDQTAAALSIPAGTVKSRLHGALARLREELDTPIDPSEPVVTVDAADPVTPEYHRTELRTI